MRWRKPILGSTPSGPAWAAFALSAVLLAGCVTSSGPGGAALSKSDLKDQIREVDLAPPPRQRVGSEPTTTSKSEPRAATYNGDGSFASAYVQSRTSARSAEPDPTPTGSLPDGAKAKDGNKGYEINFENTQVTTVVKAVLGDILGISYTVDPRVQGTVSLSSGRAIPRKDLLYVLENALRMSNVALVHDAQGYRVIPTTEAIAGSADWAHDPSAGYGISVIPLQFVSAQTLTKLLDNYAAKPGMVRAEPSRNLIIIQGTSADRRAAIGTALSFDADWMLGQSVGIYPVSNSTPEPIISEINRIIDSGQGGLSQDLVKLEPIGRQNAILVITGKRELLKRVETWITRLDKSGGAGTDVKVYRMHYGDARQVAALLNDMFVGTANNGLDSPKNQLSPGGGMVASSSGPAKITSPTPAAAGSQPSSTAAADTFNSRFSGQQVAGPAIWVKGSSGSSVANAAAPILPNVRNLRRCRQQLIADLRQPRKLRRHHAGVATDRSAAAPSCD